MRSASDARLACHQDSATTATASGIRTMRRTPFIPAIEVSSTDCSAPPKHRTVDDRGVQHVGQPHVDGKDRLPGDLVVQVETPARRAGELPIARILQRDIGRRLDLGGAVGDGAEGHAAAARACG